MRQFLIESGGFRSRVTVYGYRTHPAAGVSGERRRALLVSDTNTEQYVDSLLANSQGHLEIAGRVALPSGEKEKSLENVDKLLRPALDARLSRSDLFVVLGGGVLCDLGAFAGSIYLRGVVVELLPTTLLAMVDAAIGGKTGTNYEGYKNMIGTFYPARDVRIYPSYLATLPQREFLSGLAEVIKAGLLGDPELVSLLEDRREAVLAREPSVVAELIERAVAVKVQVVNEDLREGGRRAILSLGHTFAHALESVALLGRYSHGEAVAWGIGRAMVLGGALGLTDSPYSRRVFSLLRGYGYDLDPVSYDTRELLNAMGRDKKREGKELRFVLQRRLGETEIVPVDRGLAENTLVAKPETRYD